MNKINRRLYARTQCSIKNDFNYYRIVAVYLKINLECHIISEALHLDNAVGHISLSIFTLVVSNPLNCQQLLPF